MAELRPSSERRLVDGRVLSTAVEACVESGYGGGRILRTNTSKQPVDRPEDYNALSLQRSRRFVDLAFRRRRRHRDGHARRRRRLEHFGGERGVRLTFPPHDRALGAHLGERPAQRRVIEARLQPPQVRRAPEIALVALRRGAVVPVHVNFKTVDLDETDSYDARAPRRPAAAVARLARMQHGVARVLVDAVELGVHERRRAAVEIRPVREQHVERERARVAVGRELGAFASGGVVSDDKGVDEA